MLDLLKLEEYEESSKEQNSLFVKPAGLPYKPKLIDEITSSAHLELVFLELIKSLTRNQPHNYITIGALIQEFYKYYWQPILS